MIAGVASLAGNGDLVINGTGVDDVFQVVPGTMMGEVEVMLNGQHVGFYVPSNRIVISTFDGDDFARIDEALAFPSLMRGGNGQDTLVGGSGPDRLLGNGSGDILKGRGGDDELFGGSGFDELYGGTEDDILNGGNGNDLLEGNGGNDELTGAAGDDMLLGGGGVDTLVGGTGDDVLDGGGGADALLGGDDDDILIGGAGGDTLTGGSDQDILIGGVGGDTLTGSNGEDILIGGTTSHDADTPALQAILAEWSNLALPYLTRIANIRAGSPGFALTVGVTVVEDGATDNLNGSAGLDWFFDPATEDNLIGNGGAEVVDSTPPDTTLPDGPRGGPGYNFDWNVSQKRRQRAAELVRPLIVWSGGTDEE